ncbi:MAG: hypothetical protein ACLP5H_14880 [Desulfomonilaceae bacterium]
MTTTSQTEEAKSKHAAHESARNSDQATRPYTASPGVVTARGPQRANETFNRARTLMIPFLGYLLLGISSALAVNLVSHFAVVVPLEKNLLSAEVRSLATEIDSGVRTRSSLITMVAGNTELDSFLESGGLDKMLNALRSNFPDFLSVEITNDHGQIQAMGGDLPLSQASLFSKKPSGQISAVNLGIQHNRGIFQDDPENNCFFITCKHVGPEGGKWFTRSRFSREAVVAILKSIPARRVTIVPITGASKDIPEGPISISREELSAVRTFGSWWRGPIGAEALLTMPGLLIRMENSATPPILWRPAIAAPLFLLLCTVLAGIFFRPAAFQDSHDQDLAKESAAGRQSAVQDEKRDAEPKFCEGSVSLTENNGEMPLPVAKGPFPLQSEAEFDKPASAREFTADRGDDLSCQTKIVTIPGGNSSVDASSNIIQEPHAQNSRESELLPESLEVSWFEPSDQCEVGEPHSSEKYGGTPPSYEVEGLDSERSAEGGHLLSV